jgi:hypothetical protein
MYIISEENKNKLSRLGNPYIEESNLQVIEPYIKVLYTCSYNDEQSTGKLDIIMKQFENYLLENKMNTKDWYCYMIILKELDKLASKYYSEITFSDKITSFEEQSLYLELLNNFSFVILEKNNGNEIEPYFENVIYEKPLIYGDIEMLFWKIEDNKLDTTYKKIIDRVYQETNIKFDTLYKCETYLNHFDFENIKTFNTNVTNKKSHTIV